MHRRTHIVPKLSDNIRGSSAAPACNLPARRATIRPQRTDDAAVPSPHPRRTTPSLITCCRIGGSDSPQVRAVIGKFIAQRNTKPLMRLGCRNRVRKVIGICIALMAKIKPRLRALMSKQRIIAGNIFEFLKLHSRTCPCLPRFARNRMRRRTNSQQVNHHELAIMFPARAQETALRLPSHGERFAAVEHPRPIHALVDRSSKILDLGIIEMLASRQHAAEQKRSVDRGEFAVPYPLSGFDIDEVIKEAAFVTQSPFQKTQRLPHPIPDRRRLTVTAGFADAKAAESKAGCRNTGHPTLVAAVKQRAIPDLGSRAAG